MSEVGNFGHPWLITLKVWKDLFEWILETFRLGGPLVFGFLCSPGMKEIYLELAVCF